MRLGFLSDLHLAPKPLNRCTTDPAVLLRDLRAMIDWADDVVIVGDAFDLMRPRRLRQWRAHLAQCEDAYPQLYKEIMGCRLVYGNHDEHLKALTIPEEWACRVDGEDILATHGHQSDQWIKHVPGLAETGNFIAGWFERMNRPSLAHALGQVPDALDRAKQSLGGKPATEEEDRLLSLATYYNQQGWSIVVMGHSHGLDVIDLPDGVLINTGSHACGFRDYVLLDTSMPTIQCIRDGELFLTSTCVNRQWRTDRDCKNKDPWIALS